MKSSKTAVIAAVAICSSAVVLGSELIYESILNIKFSNKVMKLIKAEDDQMLQIMLHDPVFVDGFKWYKKIQPVHTVIHDKQGNELHADIISNTENTGKWAICCHGYRGDPMAEAPYAKHLYNNGFSIILPHMIAHQKDTNKYCSMGYRDKDNIISWINFIVNNEPDCKIALHGVSMGASAVMLATGENLPENVKCAVADCGFTDCTEEFNHTATQMLGFNASKIISAVNLVSKIRGNFDFNKCKPVYAVAASSTPTLFIHGTSDDFVPYEMLDRVYTACSAEKDRLDVKDAIHATAVAFAPDEYFEKMDKFIEKYICT